MEQDIFRELQLMLENVKGGNVLINCRSIAILFRIGWVVPKSTRITISEITSKGILLFLICFNFLVFIIFVFKLLLELLLK